MWGKLGSPWGLRTETGHTLCDNPRMFRWLIVVFLALLLINGLTPWLRKLGFGQLPGDFRFRLFGREWFIPLTTTVILSLICGLIARLV